MSFLGPILSLCALMCCIQVVCAGYGRKAGRAAGRQGCRQAGLQALWSVCCMNLCHCVPVPCLPALHGRPHTLSSPSPACWCLLKRSMLDLGGVGAKGASEGRQTLQLAARRSRELTQWRAIIFAVRECTAKSQFMIQMEILTARI